MSEKKQKIWNIWEKRAKNKPTAKYEAKRGKRKATAGQRQGEGEAIARQKRGKGKVTAGHRQGNSEAKARTGSQRSRSRSRRSSGAFCSNVYASECSKLHLRAAENISRLGVFFRHPPPPI